MTPFRGIVAAGLVAISIATFPSGAQARTLTIEATDGRTFEVEVPDYGARREYSPEEEARIQVEASKRALYRVFREAKCESFRTMLEALYGGMQPIQVSGTSYVVTPDINALAQSAQGFIDTLRDPRLQNYMVDQVNRMLRTPGVLMDSIQAGVWTTACYDFMAVNYFPEAAKVFDR